MKMGESYFAKKAGVGEIEQAFQALDGGGSGQIGMGDAMKLISKYRGSFDKNKIGNLKDQVGDDQNAQVGLDGLKKNILISLLFYFNWKYIFFFSLNFKI